MARAKTFTDEQIITAAHKLLDAGKAVNGTSLRNLIGSGRPSTLIERFLELKSENKIAEFAPPSVEVEEKVHDMTTEIIEMKSILLSDFENMMVQINNAAHNVVEGRLNRAIEEANNIAMEAAKRESEMLEQMNTAFEEVEDTRDLLSDSQDDITQLKKDLQAKCNAFDKLELQLDQAKAEKQSLTEQLENSRTEYSRLEEKNTSSANQLSEANAQVVVLTGKLAESQDSNQSLQAEIQSLTNQLSEQAQINAKNLGKVEQLEISVNDLKESNNDLASDIKKAEVQNKQLENERSTLTAKLESAQALTAEVKQQLAEHENHLEELSDKLATAQSNAVASQREAMMLRDQLESQNKRYEVLESELKRINAGKNSQ